MMEALDYPKLEMLIEKIREKSGFDFSGYTRPSLLRRAARYLEKREESFPHLLDGLGAEKAADLVQNLTVNYSEMFRDPDFFSGLRTHVFGYLASFAAVRCWVAGCASGEEAYSLAILMKEAGLEPRTVIYATDLNKKVLTSAREGVFSLGMMKNYSQKYLASGGRSSLSDYYQVSYNKAVMAPELRKNIVFSMHDLIGDGVFNEFQMISCRNVMIYFTLEQRKKVLELLYQSLGMFGFLCLGKRESLRYSGLEDRFRVISLPLNIYQKIL